MRIALTGSTGLIGSAVARRLDHHEVVRVGRRDSADIRVDLTDANAMAVLDLGDIDALVHCAGVVDEDFRDDPDKAMQTAVFGSDALVQAALRGGADRLAYISSAHIYGPMVGRVDESCEPNPSSNYAIAHYATEQVFRRYAKNGVAAAALRPCAVFGELPDIASFRRWSLIPFSFPRDAIINHQIVLESTGEQRRNFVGSDDIADSCAAWLDSRPAGWTAFNPVGAMDSSVYEFAQLCADLAQELSGERCGITRRAADGPTFGDDFSYVSLAPGALGTQSARETVKRLMVALQQER